MNSTADSDIVLRLLKEAGASDVAAALSPAQLQSLYAQVVAALGRAAAGWRQDQATPPVDPSR